MGEESARLRQEIDQTREDLTRDVDLIAEKTSPSRIVERRVERTKRGLAGLKDKVMGGGSDDDPSDDPYGAGYYGSAYVGGGRYESTGQSGSDGPGAGDKVREQLSAARESVGGTASAVQDRAQQTVVDARRQTEGNPLAAGLVAFGIGWLVSSLLPATEAEIRAARQAQDTAREHGTPVLEATKQAAGEVAEDLKGSAQEAVQQVKEHAQEAAQTVKDEGASAAQTVKDEGTSAAQTVKDDARQHASS